jgi:MFS family permease
MLTSQPPERGARALPRGVWVLGFVSLLMDTSSELVHSLLPILMVTTLGASVITVGLIEGIAEATASVTRILSGTISDYIQRRKLLVVLGYALGAVTKPVFPLATSVSWVFGARFVDRVGKGIRGAPRDALIADIAPAPLRGAAYGLRLGLDSVGAFLGPLLAVAFMFLLSGNLRAVLWVASLPALLAVLLLIVMVREPARPRADTGGHHTALTGAGRLPRRYWLVVALGALFTLARFSEAFLVLRATDVGLSAGQAPVIMIVMSAVYAGCAYPAGAAADRVGVRSLLILGLLALIVADLFLAIAASPAPALVGAGFWGLHMALTQGLLSKLVADTAPAGLRGTAFGVFHLASGAALLGASVMAGALWTNFGAPVTFIGGAVFAALAALGLLLLPASQPGAPCWDRPA